jgi:DNA-binding SARP family transcriptional activator
MSVPRHPDQPAFRFSCLGPVELTSATGAAVPFRTRKQAALLLLLARQPGTPLLRTHLLDLLWSGAGEASARHSLSHSASLINKALACEAIAPSGKDQIALADGLVWLDVTAFERHVRNGESREARALWRGNLFEGLHVPRAPRFERWAETERQRLARAMREALAALVDLERTAGAWRAMRETAETLLAFDPFDEGAMLACLEASSLLGDRTLALRRYREFETLLRGEPRPRP